MGWISRTCALLMAVAAGGGQLALGQRPQNASICDYYAQQRFGKNNSDTQFQLMQGIVALAFGGGSGLSNASNSSTGILNPGVQDGLPVSLIHWFDGSKATTNFNGAPVGIDWLDDGGAAPLHAFLNGSTPNVTLSDTSNESRLFLHFYSAFGFIFGCTAVHSFPQVKNDGGPGSSTTGFISVAYVHKFMNLNQTDLGYFIDQLTTASQYYGFSQTDANTLNTAMRSRYAVKCAPPVNGQLYSLCQADECPLAEPSPDCSDYINIGPNGVGGNATSSAGPTQTATGAGGGATVTQTVSESATSAAATTSAAAAASSPALSTGGIAGVAIGGAAVLIFAGILVFFLRRKRRSTPPPTATGTGAAGAGSDGPNMVDNKTASSVFPPTSPYPSHASYASPHGSTYNSYNPYGAPAGAGMSGSPEPAYSVSHSPGRAELASQGATGGGVGYAPRPGDVNPHGGGGGGFGHIPEMPDSGSMDGHGAGYRDSTATGTTWRVSAASPQLGGGGSPGLTPSPGRSPLGFGEHPRHGS